MTERLEGFNKNGSMHKGEEAEKSPIAVKFVYAEHSGAYSEEIVEALLEGDVIAFEVVGATWEERNELMNAINDIADIKKSPSARLRRLIARHKIRGLNTIELTKLVERITSTGKQVVLIDAYEKSPRWEAGERAEELFVDYFEGIFLEFNLQELRKKLAEVIGSWADDVRDRDKLVLAQVRGLLGDLDKVGVGVLTVFEGLVHTSTHHALSQEGWDVQRDFFPRAGDVPGRDKPIKARFSNFLESMRELVFFPDRELSEDHLDKALLWSYALVFFNTSLPSIGDSVVDDNIRGVVDGISAQKRKDILKQIGNIVNSASSPGDARREVAKFWLPYFSKD